MDTFGNTDNRIYSETKAIEVTVDKSHIVTIQKQGKLLRDALVDT